MMSELDFSLSLLRELKSLRNRFAADSVKKSEKADGSPVTELDQKLNDAIVGAIQETFPNDLVVSEESGLSLKRDSSRIWFVDPLDGTKEFIKNLPEWSVHIGLVENGEVIFGLVGALDLDKIYYANKGRGAFLKLAGGSESQLHCRNANRISDLNVVVSRSRPDSRIDSFLDKHEVRSKIPLGSMGLKMCYIAEGNADLYLNLDGSCSLWDTCAPQVILQEAGGHVSYLDGSPIDYLQNANFELKKGFATCSKSCWQMINGLSFL